MAYRADINSEIHIGSGRYNIEIKGAENPQAKKILIVDDSIVLRSLLRNALIGKGFVVHSAQDGEQAARQLDDPAHIDLIITDYHMPGLDGAALVRAIRQHPRHRRVPVLVLTAGADATEKQCAREAGASGWIVKPFDPGKLADAIGRLTA